MENIFNYDINSLEKKLENIGEKKFRAKQIFVWIYQKKVYDFDQMSDISKVSKEKLKKTFNFEFLSIAKKQESKDKTVKFLLQLKDGQKIEAVLMRYKYGNAVCVSSQVGCNMGCSFCASGLTKKIRNLSVSEMVLQVLLIKDYLDKEDERLSHVVVMGSGEPFDNYENLVSFLKVINSPFSFAIGARHISVSTCGIVPKIIDFSKLGLQVNLAISLHFADDEKRNKMMPINKAYPLEKLIKSLKTYQNNTNRRITIEYILMKDINDSKEDAINLSNLLKNLIAYVNLIPYNEITQKEYKRSSKKTMLEFYDTLKKRGVNVTIRRELGEDIDAACGQLKIKQKEQSNE